MNDKEKEELRKPKKAKKRVKKIEERMLMMRKGCCNLRGDIDRISIVRDEILFDNQFKGGYHLPTKRPCGIISFGWLLDGFLLKYLLIEFRSYLIDIVYDCYI